MTYALKTVLVAGQCFQNAGAGRGHLSAPPNGLQLALYATHGAGQEGVGPGQGQGLGRRAVSDTLVMQNLGYYQLQVSTKILRGEGTRGGREGRGERTPDSRHPHPLTPSPPHSLTSLIFFTCSLHLSFPPGFPLHSPPTSSLHSSPPSNYPPRPILDCGPCVWHLAGPRPSSRWTQPLLSPRQGQGTGSPGLGPGRGRGRRGAGGRPLQACSSRCGRSPMW